MNVTLQVMLVALLLPVAVGGCVAVERPAPAPMRETIVVPAQPAPANRVIVVPDAR